MSLILDALRRAESERERGSVPGLNAQPAPLLAPEPMPRAAARSWHWLVAALGLGLGLLGAAGWYLAGRAGEPAPVAAAPTMEAARAAAAMSAPAPPPAIAPAPPAAGPVPATLPPPAAPAAEPAPWPEPRRPAEPAAAKPAAAPVTAGEQLPEFVRSQLPPLAFGGSMYSANPGNRSLIINGQIFRENDRVTPDLTLTEIRPKTAVFQFRGYRFEVPY